MEEQKKSNTVPYLSAAKMDKLLQLVSDRSLNNISAAYFKSYGFGEADAYLAMNTLRFLKLVDDNDKPTEHARKFQLRGEARDKEVEPIVRTAYKDLFDSVSEPQNLPKDELINEFMHSYSLSSRIAKSAVPAFLKLCEFAGLVEQGSVLTRTRQSQSGGATKSTKKLTGKSNSKSITTEDREEVGSTIVPFAGGKVKLVLPTEILTKAIFEGKLNDDIKELTGCIQKFVNEHMKVETSDNTEGESKEE